MNCEKLVKLCKKEKCFEILEIIFFSCAVVLSIGLIPLILLAERIFLMIYVLITIICVAAGVVFSRKAIKYEDAVCDYVSVKIMNYLESWGNEITLIDYDDYFFFAELSDKSNRSKLEKELEEILQPLREITYKSIEVHLF